MSVSSALEVTKGLGAAPLVQAQGGLQTNDAPMAVIIDNTTTAGYTYICEAAPGTLSSAAAWRISRLTSTGSVTWANGNANFTNIADNRASATYS